MLCGSHADTTVRAVISLPSSTTTPATPFAAQSIAVTRELVRTFPPAASNAASKATGTMPLPPTGRPTEPAWRRA